MGNDLPPLRDVVDQYELRAKKSLGQNFLFDSNITDRIAASAGDLTGKTVIEIGPGPGGLTRSLLNSKAEKIIAIEFDPRAVAAIKDLTAHSDGRLQVMQEDALKMDWDQFMSQHKGAAIVANLPYNIATPLLMGWLEHIARDPACISKMVLMFQKEVADRIMAAPSTKPYGRVSVLAQWVCTIENMMTLPPTVFVPAPKVHSSVLRFIPGVRKDSVTWDAMDKVLTQAFAQRRKMLRTTLKDRLDDLVSLNIDPTLRAENLTVADYIRITEG